jgi:DHA3 family macrolide efflux protein-like MFS transporter
MGSMATAMNPLGLAIAGPVADSIGIRPWFSITAVMLVAGGVAGMALPALRNIETEAAERTVAATVAEVSEAPG